MDKIISKSGKKISLRLPTGDDVGLLYDFAKEIEGEDTFILLNPNEPLTMEEEEKYVEKLIIDIKEKKKLTYMALDESRVIGSCDVTVLGKRQGHVGRMGISLLKEYRGDGIGKKLLVFVMEKAKEKLGISQIVLNCFANNEVACRLYESVGFREYGLHPRAVKYKGGLVDEKMFVKDL